VLTSVLAAVLVVLLQPVPARSQPTESLCVPVRMRSSIRAGGKTSLWILTSKVLVFEKGLNFPTGIAFRGDKDTFKVFVLESGDGLRSCCNEGDFGFSEGNASAPGPEVGHVGESTSTSRASRSN